MTAVIRMNCYPIDPSATTIPVGHPNPNHFVVNKEAINSNLIESHSTTAATLLYNISVMLCERLQKTSQRL